MSRVAQCLAMIGAGVLVADYALQLLVLQPALLNGETEGLSPWSQYNPHGVFIGLEDVGNALLGVGFVFLGAALRGASAKPARVAARVFLGGGAAVIATLVFCGIVYRARLEYRFEVTSLLITWLVLLATGVLLAVTFARSRRQLSAASDWGGGEMAVTVQSSAGSVQGREPADVSRKNAVLAGVLFIVATAASLLSGPFLAPVIDSGYLAAATHHGQVATGVLLGFVAALAAPGIAVTLYPVLRRFGAGLALAAVGFRIIEGMFYAMGMVILLSLSMLSKEFVDSGAPADQHFPTFGDTMLAQYKGLVDVGLLLAFSLGGLMYYLVFYRSRLIPAWLSAWGIIGVVLLMVATVLIIFDVIDPSSAGQIVLAIPIAVQEMVLAVWLIVKGFNRAALAAPRP